MKWEGDVYILAFQDHLMCCIKAAQLSIHKLYIYLRSVFCSYKW